MKRKNSGKCGDMPEKEERRQNIADFFRGFFITLAIVLPVFVTVGMISRLNSASSADELLQTLDSDRTVPINATKSYNLLWVLFDSDTNNLQSVDMVRFDVENYRIVACNIPYTSVMLDLRAPVSIQQLYAQRGVLGVRDAIEETLQIPVSGYVAIGTKELVKMVDKLGEISFSLEKELTVTNADGMIIYTKPAGTSMYSGDDIVNLIVYGNYYDAGLMRLHEDLWQAVFRQYGDDKFSEKLSGLYSSLVNEIDTDINSAGIYSFCLTVNTVCGSGGTQVETVRPKGEFVDGRFEFAQGSDEHLWSFFERKAA